MRSGVRPLDTSDAYCPACNQGIAGFRPGGHRGRRKRARCPNCNALERHRFLALLLDGLAPLVTRTGSMLDIAPSPQLADRIRQMSPGRYVRIDLAPEEDRRAVDVQASLTALPFADGLFTLIVCFHVLEHIPDDAAAMRELARTLAPGGLIIAQVPYQRREPTEEDPSASPEERVRRFGQEDHVRRYGIDFETRLATAGLAGLRVEARDILTEDGARYFGIPPLAVMWLLRRAEGAATSGVEAETGYPQRTIADLVSEVQRQRQQTGALERRLTDSKREAEQQRAAYERLRYHPLVGAVVTGTRPLRRLWRRWLGRSRR